MKVLFSSFLCQFRVLIFKIPIWLNKLKICLIASVIGHISFMFVVICISFVKKGHVEISWGSALLILDPGAFGERGGRKSQGEELLSLLWRGRAAR